MDIQEITKQDNVKVIISEEAVYIFPKNKNFTGTEELEISKVATAKTNFPISQIHFSQYNSLSPIAGN
jgi:hypothetical protein